MSNSWFQFKQFTIQQDRCAMKVSTDACIQGAWTPILSGVKTVLDIGTGTGLLSLMLAQRCVDLHIDAIELDRDAASQASRNVSASPWASRIHVMEADVRMYETGKYDMIICNPPFFQNSLLGPEQARNTARHTLSLEYTDLLNALERLLADKGYASVLLPYPEYTVWQALLEERGWNIFSKLTVQHRSHTSPTRIISLCSKAPANLIKDTLVIKDYTDTYTKDFEVLLRPYYLKL